MKRITRKKNAKILIKKFDPDEKVLKNRCFSGFRGIFRDPVQIACIYQMS